MFSEDGFASEFESFIEEFGDKIARSEGKLKTRTTDFFPLSSFEIVKSLNELSNLGDVPELSQSIHVVDDLSKWILNASENAKIAAGLDLEVPPLGIHYISGKYPIFYDFLNLDIVLSELLRAGATLTGRFLDFGCSTGRNLAVLERAFSERLDLFGVDPSGPSIDWLNRHVSGVHAFQNDQHPPLPFEDSFFDTVIAKSIWTHFSRNAARSWFLEISRCLKPGGFFFFSTHGPHDVASRIIRDVPRPRYERYTGHPNWTRDEFLLAIITGLRSKGHFFQAFKDVAQDMDIHGSKNPDTADWGLSFMLPEFVEELLPDDLHIVRYDVARTGGRHDAYTVQKSQ